jgi:amino acid transporter
MGVLLMLVSYFVCNTGAIVYLYFRGERRAPAFEIVIPLIALAIIVYVLYQNTLADSLVSPYTKFPLVVGAWLLLGLLIAVLVPDLARRIGEGLAREEGIKAR